MPGITEDKRLVPGVPTEKKTGRNLHSAGDVLTYYVDASEAKGRGGG